MLIGEAGKRHYIFIKGFNTFMYDHTLHRGRKHFFRYCLQDFSTEEISRRHIKDYFKINGKQRVIMPKKGEYVKFKNYERKIKSPYIIYADFENISCQNIMDTKSRRVLYKQISKTYCF